LSIGENVQAGWTGEQGMERGAQAGWYGDTNTDVGIGGRFDPLAVERLFTIDV